MKRLLAIILLAAIIAGLPMAKAAFAHSRDLDEIMTLNVCARGFSASMSEMPAIPDQMVHEIKILPAVTRHTALKPPMYVFNAATSLERPPKA